MENQTASTEVGGETWEVVDTPGIHSLYAQSEENSMVRRSVFEDPPDVLLQCVDARRMKQSLVLTSDLAELGIPMVISLNATGEARKEGIRTDAAALQSALGVPVVDYESPGGNRVALREAILRAVAPSVRVKYGERVEASVRIVESSLPSFFSYRRKAALLALQGDEGVLADVAGACPGWNAEEARARAAERFADLGGTLSRAIAERTDLWVDRTLRGILKHSDRPGGRFGETVGWVCRHPVYGLMVLLGFLSLLYVAVVKGSSFLSGILEGYVAAPIVAAVQRAIPPGFWADLVVGNHGLLTMGLFNAICRVLPILFVFFLFFGFAEDVGYLPNLTVLSHRLFGLFGLGGNSVISLILGFGCKTMATLTARSLRSPREKLIAVSLIAFAIPCAPHFGLNIALLGRYGVPAFLVGFGVLVVVEVAAGLVLDRILPPEPPESYVQELPPIRAPRLLGLLSKTGHRLLSFLREAIPVFLVAALVLFALDKLGILAAVQRALSPAVTRWMGLPIEMVEVLVLSFARAEAAVGVVLRLADAGKLDAAQAVVSVVVTTTFAQCVANMFAMFRVLRARAATAAILTILVLSFLLGGIVHWVLVFTEAGRWL
jgi:ferrous iron transport protein B